MPPSDTVTVLHHATIPQAKTWKKDGTIQPTGGGKHYSLSEKPVHDLRSLSAVLNILEAAPCSAVVRGKYLGDKLQKTEFPDEVKPGKVLRRVSLFQDVQRYWFMFDVDGFMPNRDPMVDPVGAVREFIESALPAPFHGVSFHWHLSASFGHPTKNGGLRVHLWFWLKRPYKGEHLRELVRRNGIPVDVSLFNPIQLHYTANPIFEDGVVDPVKTRSGLAIEEFGDVVNLNIPDDIATEENETPPPSRQQKLHEAWTNDRLAQWLFSTNRVKSTRKDGGLNIECLIHDEHSSESGESSTVFYPAYTYGYTVGTFVCLHSHGSEQGFSRRCHQAARELGFDDIGDVFGPHDNAVNLMRADQITPEPISWLWDGWLARGKMVLKAGSPGTGKTTLAMDMAATVTTGGNWPDGTTSERGSVVVWSGEDDPADTLIPRLLAGAADLSRVHFVVDAIGPDGPRPFDPARDMPLLLQQVERLGDVCLIIVNPIVSAVAGDSHKNAEVRRGLQPLVDLAAKIGACLIGITHFTKGTGGRDTTERVTGSLAFAALARVVIATAKDAQAGDSIITRSKSNIGPDGGGFRYHLEQVDIAMHPGLSASRVVWGEAVEGNARELITEMEGPQGNEKPDDAASWLLSLLSVSPMRAAEVYDYGAKKGFNEKKLQRTLKKIGGITEKSAFQGAWWWKLPGGEIPTIGDDDGEL